MEDVLFMISLVVSLKSNWDGIMIQIDNRSFRRGSSHIKPQLCPCKHIQAMKAHENQEKKSVTQTRSTLAFVAHWLRRSQPNMVITIYIWHTYDMPSYECVQQYTMCAVKYAVKYIWIHSNMLSLGTWQPDSRSVPGITYHGQAWFQILANGSSADLSAAGCPEPRDFPAAGKAWLRRCFFWHWEGGWWNKKDGGWSWKRKIKGGLCF